MNTDAPVMSAPQGADAPNSDAPEVTVLVQPPSDDLPLWDSIEYLYANMAALSMAPGQVTELLRAKDLIDRVPNKQALVNNASILQRDVVDFNARLRAIHDGHKHRTGDAVDPDDQMAGLQVYQEYMAWEESYRTVVIPTVQVITDTFLALVEPPATSETPATPETPSHG